MRLAITTCPVDQADRIAEALLEHRLVACVNILPGATSKYWWQGKIETESEAVLLLKTQAKLVPQLIQTLRQHHPYEVPELLTFRVEEGFQGYLDWLVESTSSPETPS